MASAIAKRSEILDEYVEATMIGAGRVELRVVLACPGYSDWAHSGSLCVISGCAEYNGAKYWRLICWFMVLAEEIKSLCG